jgi:hypothetical protein
MKAIITYPIPFNLWQHYKHFVRRFASTFKEFPPGTEDYELHVTCYWGEPTDQIRRLFYGIKTVMANTYNDSCDIGASQWAGKSTWTGSSFVVGMSTHNYFHREGWLKRLMEARREFGPGLYAASGSLEEIPHLRTAGYGMDSELWKEFPNWISSRQDCTAFERGPDSISNYLIKRKSPVKQVLWDSVQDLVDCRKPDNIFRKGNQEQMLWWDRHVDIWKDSEADEKERLTAMADGTTKPSCIESEPTAAPAIPTS